MFAANAPNGGLSSDDFSTVLLKHAINGKLYCSLSGLNAAVGDRVRWHIATLVCLHLPCTPVAPTLLMGFYISAKSCLWPVP